MFISTTLTGFYAWSWQDENEEKGRKTGWLVWVNPVCVIRYSYQWTVFSLYWYPLNYDELAQPWQPIVFAQNIDPLNCSNLATAAVCYRQYYMYIVNQRVNHITPRYRLSIIIYFFTPGRNKRILIFISKNDINVFQLFWILFIISLLKIKSIYTGGANSLPWNCIPPPSDKYNCQQNAFIKCAILVAITKNLSNRDQYIFFCNYIKIKNILIVICNI